MKRVELRVTLPGQESADDALRAVVVIQKLLVVLGGLETTGSFAHPGSRQDKSQWGFEDLKLGSVVATLAPRKPRRGGSLTDMVETLHRLDIDLTGGLEPGAYLQKIRDAAE